MLLQTIRTNALPKLIGELFISDCALVDKRFDHIDYNAYHIQKSLVWFEDAEAEPMPDMIRGIEWRSVRQEIEGAVRAMGAM